MTMTPEQFEALDEATEREYQLLLRRLANEQMRPVSTYTRSTYLSTEEGDMVGFHVEQERNP